MKNVKKNCSFVQFSKYTQYIKMDTTSWTLVEYNCTYLTLSIRPLASSTIKVQTFLLIVFKFLYGFKDEMIFHLVKCFFFGGGGVRGYRIS